jgi:hypothetical protein
VDARPTLALRFGEVVSVDDKLLHKLAVEFSFSIQLRVPLSSLQRKVVEQQLQITVRTRDVSG